MKTKITKIIKSLVLVCLLMLVTTGVQALTHGDFKYEYTEDGKGISITGYINYETTNLVIPDTIEDKPVVGISSGAFVGLDNITSISFGKNIVRIGSNAFWGCTGLTGTIDLPTNIEYVSAYAFDGTNLTKVTLNGKSVYEKTQDGYIYYMDFDQNGLIICDLVREKFQNIETITIPSTIDGQQVIDVYAYFGGTSLTKVIFNNQIIYGVTDEGYVYRDTENSKGVYIYDIIIGKFEGIQEVTIPTTIDGKEVESVEISIYGTDIKKVYFKGKIYTGLTEQGLYYFQNDDNTITIHGYTLEYDDFGNPKPLDVVIPDTIDGMKVTTIDSFVFSHSNINSIDFGKNVTTIGIDAFYMTEFAFDVLNLPANITNIAESAFSGSNISITQNGKKLVAIYDNIQYTFKDDHAIVTGITRGIGDNVVILSSVDDIPVTVIGDSALITAELDNLGDNIKTLTVPSSITKIGERAFGRIFAFGMGGGDPDFDGRLLAYDIYFEGNAPEINAYTFASYKGTVTYASGKTGYDTELWQEVLGGIVTTEKIDKAIVDTIEDKTYTGTAITPKPAVKIGNTTLTEGIDYTLSYSNNINAGTATITITGKGNYTGTKTVTFEIVKDESKIVLTTGTYEVGKDLETGIYKLSSSQWDSIIIFNELEERISSHYGNDYIKITAEAAFIKVEGTVELEKVDIDNMPVNIKTTLTEGGYIVGKDLTPGVYKFTTKGIYASVDVYDDFGGEIITYIELFDGYIKIPEGALYVRVNSATLEKTDLNEVPVNIKTTLTDGKYRVGIDLEVGKYKFVGERVSVSDSGWSVIDEVLNEGYLTITDEAVYVYITNGTLTKVEEEPEVVLVDIATAAVNAIEDKIYTGSAITPKPVVKVGNTTLVEGTDYTLTYSNNANVGTATITITGKGNYTGTKTVTFNIVEPEVEEPDDKGYIDFNIDKTVSYDKGTVTVKITALKPVTDYELVLTLDNITENISVVNKLAGSNAKVKGNKVTMYMIQLAAQSDKTVYPAGTVLAEITYKIPEGYFEANKGFDGTATVVNTCDVRITDNGTNYEYSLTKNVTVKDINVQEILQETLKEITIDNNSVQGIKSSLEQATGMTVVIKNIDGVILEEDSKVGTGTVVEVLDANGTVVSSETVSINGEINGDGEIDFFDAIQMISLVYDTDETFEWHEAVRKAAKFGEEGIPEFFDIITLISYIYG